MSDRAVMRAVEEAISNYRAAISGKVAQQGHIADMMMQAGNTGDALYALTTRYKEYDREIGDLRNSIRNLQVNN